MRARGVRPSSLALVSLHDQRRGGAVALSGQESPAVTPPPPKASGSSAELLQRRGGARAVVFAHLGAVGQGDRGDLAVEEAVFLRFHGQFLRALGELVHVLAADAVLVGDVDGGDAHVDVGVGLAVLADQVRIAVIGAGRLGALVEAAYPLDSGGDVDIALAGLTALPAWRIASRLEAQ